MIQHAAFIHLFRTNLAIKASASITKKLAKIIIATAAKSKLIFKVININKRDK